MSNVRVFSLARDLNLSSQEVIDRLHKMGIEVKTASSSVDEYTADKLRRALKIDALTTRKKRVYGSDEDETERERIERELQEKVAAERAERERAAEAARAAAEARKSGRRRPLLWICLNSSERRATWTATRESAGVMSRRQLLTTWERYYQ